MYYVIRNKETELFIDLDKPSGGYPYRTTFPNAHLFTSKKDAESMLNFVKQQYEGFAIYELIPTFTEIK